MVKSFVRWLGPLCSSIPSLLLHVLGAQKAPHFALQCQQKATVGPTMC